MRKSALQKEYIFKKERFLPYLVSKLRKNLFYTAYLSEDAGSSLFPDILLYLDFSS